MKVAHFDCFSGISGDMVLGAVIDAGASVDRIRETLASIALPITLEVERVRKCGISACHARVIAEDQEDYRFLPDIEALIGKAKLTDKQRSLALRIFRKLAEAEAEVHGIAINKVHFHEVGALDSIADIVGAAVGLDLLGVDEFSSRPVPTGHGFVKCDHGMMPIPAPATAVLLKGCPLAETHLKGELTTPTGAAILTSVVTLFTPTPALNLERIGHGAGTKDFIDQPNVLRLLVGSRESAKQTDDSITVLETNLDDCTPECIGYCFDRLMNAGALDVYTIPIQMKKQRHGILMTVLVEESRRPQMEAILFEETLTFGIRRSTMARTVLMRETIQIPTTWGPVAAKRGWRDGWEIITPEYEDCRRVASEHKVPLREVYAAVAGKG